MKYANSQLTYSKRNIHGSDKHFHPLGDKLWVRVRKLKLE